MNAYIITIGDEILIGQIMNTNGAFIGEKLSHIGIPAEYMVVVGDDEEKILGEFKRAIEVANVVIVTGGLGPTHDDVTRSAVCKFFDTDLVPDEEVHAAIIPGRKPPKIRHWCRAKQHRYIINTAPLRVCGLKRTESTSVSCPAYPMR